MIIQLQRKRCAHYCPTSRKVEPSLSPVRARVSSYTEAGLIPLRSYDISQGYDARVIEYPHDAEFFITNPPWTRQLLHPIIVNLKRQKPTWLLFDADWAHTIQAAPYLSFCRKIVSVGRVKWIGSRYHAPSAAEEARSPRRCEVLV